MLIEDLATQKQRSVIFQLEEILHDDEEEAGTNPAAEKIKEFRNSVISIKSPTLIKKEKTQEFLPSHLLTESSDSEASNA